MLYAINDVQHIRLDHSRLSSNRSHFMIDICISTEVCSPINDILPRLLATNMNWVINAI